MPIGAVRVSAAGFVVNRYVLDFHQNMLTLLFLRKNDLRMRFIPDEFCSDSDRTSFRLLTRDSCNGPTTDSLLFSSTRNLIPLID